MIILKENRMTYFTSWEINLFLCLISLGLPYDLVRDWTKKLKGVHRDLVLKEARDYYLDRKEWLPDTGSEKERKLLRNRRAMIWLSRYGKEINMRAISPIKSITHNFWMSIQKVHWEYERKLEDIEPEDRYEYFEWAYDNHYYTWTPKDLEWVKGFHPGRFFLLDHRRKEILEDIRDLESIGAWQEERFIRKQNHIEDLLNGKSSYSC